MVARSSSSPVREEKLSRFKRGSYLAIIVEEGPRGEEDFLDHRHWFKRAREVQTEPTAPIKRDVYPEWSRNFLHAMGTNIRESLTERHILEPGQYVLVTEATDEDGQTRYILDTLPDAIRYFAGGPFSAIGTQRMLGLTSWYGGEFQDRFLFAKPAQSEIRDFIWFDAGDSKGKQLYATGTFLLDANSPVPENRIPASVIRWNGTPDGLTGDWEMVLDKQQLGEGHALVVYKSQLYAFGSQAAGVNPSNAMRTLDGDNWSDISNKTADISGKIYCAKVWQPPGSEDEYLFVGGTLNTFNASRSKGIVYWDGSTWKNLGNGVTVNQGGGFAQTGEVRALEVYRGVDNEGEEKLYLAGHFDYVDGVQYLPHGNVARLNKSLEYEKAGAGLSVTGTVTIGYRALRTYREADQWLLFAAGLEGTQGDPLVAWNDEQWVNKGEVLSNTEPNAPRNVFALEVIAGKLAVGGKFTRRQGLRGQSACRRICFYDFDAEVFSGIGQGFAARPHTLLTFKDRKFAGTSDPDLHFAELVNDVWISPGAKFGARIRKLIEYKGLIYALGAFQTIGGMPALRIARSTDGITWEAFTTFNDETYCAAVKGEDLWVGGAHTQGGGLNGPGLHSWSGVGAWVPRLAELSIGAEPGTIKDMIFVGDDLYLVGEFDTIQGTTGDAVATKGLARLDTTTGEVFACGGGLEGIAIGNKLAYFAAADEVIVAGNFNGPVGGMNNILRYDPVADSLNGVSGGSVSSPIEAVAAFNDGSGEAVYFDHHGQVGSGLATYGVTKLTPAGALSRVGEEGGELDNHVTVIRLENGVMEFGGDFLAVGEPSDRPDIPEMYFALYGPDGYVHARGGVGFNPTFSALQLGGGDVQTLFVYQPDDEPCKRMLLGLTVYARSSIYCESISAVTDAGHRNIQGGLRDSSLQSVPAQVYGVVKLSNGRWGIVGNFGQGYNPHLGEDLPEGVAELVRCNCVMEFDGTYLIPMGDGLIGGAQEGLAMTEYLGSVVAGGSEPPQIFDRETKEWSKLGGEHWQPNSATNWMMVHGEKLAALGALRNNNNTYQYAEFDGMSEIWTQEAITGMSELRHGLKIDRGQGEEFYVGGIALPGYTCIRKRVGSAFADLPGLAIEGECRSITFLNSPTLGWILVAAGGFNGAIDGQVVYYRFDTEAWHFVAESSILGIATWVWADQRRGVVLLGAGGIDTLVSEGGEANIAVFNPEDGSVKIPFEGGVNGFVSFIGDGTETMRFAP
ncbi:MAG: hypothetical protein MI923_20445 [Phycisphaerales bacterium]|nr:hypothetical protein [Phycisphaerales bacterium]